jgi:hypothetical protein
MRALRQGRLRWTGGTVLLLLLLAPAGAHGEKRYEAERFDVRVRLQEDGTTIVTETVIFRFEGGTFTQVTRELPLRRTDGIDVLEGGLDDVALGRGREAGPTRLEVSRHDSDLRIAWRFPATAGVHRFTLIYLVRGLVERGPGEDLLAWTALPRHHEYRITGSRITLAWPPSAHLRQLTAGGRPVNTGDDGATFNLQRLGRDESITLRATFEPGTGAPQAPAWQQRADRQRRTAPIWIATAAAVFVGFSGFLWLLWARSPRPNGTEAFGASTVSEPPGQLPPAMAGGLVSGGGSPSPRHTMAGLLALADRGLLQIEERPPRRWHSREFVLRSVGGEGAWASLHPHERAMLRAAFSKKGKAELEVPMATVGTRMVGGARAINRAVREELIAAGLLDPDRLSARRHLMIAAIVVLGLGLLYLPVGILLVERYGPWPFLVLPGLDAAGVVGILLAASLRPQTDEGLRQRERWKRYGTYLKRAARKDETNVPVSSTALPFAVAFGAAAGYARALRQRGEPLPSWFQAANAAADERGDAFVALMATGGWTGSSGSSGAGVGGGAAAGGGSSGAS